MNFLHAVDREDFARGTARELVGAVRGADRDGKRVDLGDAGEFCRLIRIREELLAGHLGVGAVAVFLVAAHRFKRAEAADFAFDGNADAVGHFHHAAGDVDVVFVGGDGLAVAHEGAVHHDGGEARADGALADRRALAVVLVHADGNVRIGFNSGFNEVAQERFARILASARRGLHDHGSADFARRLHDGLNLFEVVDVEGGNAVAVFSRMIEQLSHGNKSHCVFTPRWMRGAPAKTGGLSFHAEGASTAFRHGGAASDCASPAL